MLAHVCDEIVAVDSLARLADLCPIKEIAQAVQIGVPLRQNLVNDAAVSQSGT